MAAWASFEAPGKADGSPMDEVVLRLRFTQASLGAARRKEGSDIVFAMLRNPDGQVMFLPTWWRSISRFAATVLNVPTELVARVEWDPAVDGITGRWRRYFPQENGEPTVRRRYALHEAFLKGEMIGVNCVLPQGLMVDQFWRLMDTAGRYKGISPYKPGQYGTFQVVEVQQRRWR
jgi:hypothetical protein